MPNIAILTLTVNATAALIAQRFVTIGGKIATAAGNSLGVVRTDAEAGDAVAVDAVGTTTVTAGGTFAAGDALEVGADGKAVAHDAGQVVGRALSAGEADKPCEILLIQN